MRGENVRERKIQFQLMTMNLMDIFSRESGEVIMLSMRGPSPPLPVALKRGYSVRKWLQNKIRDKIFVHFDCVSKYRFQFFGAVDVCK